MKAAVWIAVALLAVIALAVSYPIYQQWSREAARDAVRKAEIIVSKREAATRQQVFQLP